MLLSFPSFLKSNPDNEKIVRAGVDFMLSLEQDNFNYPPAMDEVKRRRPDREELVHWCHGAPGEFQIFIFSGFNAIPTARVVWRLFQL